MSTIASPRQSLTLSSRRDSTDTDVTSRSASTTRGPVPPSGSLRRNRAALRDYYGLKAAQLAAEAPSPSPSSALASADVETESELDREGFNADEYVQKLLATESLEGILRTEASLISETRSLDGEKKALVYDNYSKLIAATETIRKMRTNMDPLTPTTSSLTPLISHIAETATGLSESLKKQHDAAAGRAGGPNVAAQKTTVRWVLDSPRRLQTLVEAGQRQDAESQWSEVQRLLGKWRGVEGVDRVSEACKKVLARDDT